MFNDGKLVLPEKEVDFGEIVWWKHPTFEGGSGRCVNAGSVILYEAGTISVLRVGAPHEVAAGLEGLYLFAKFMPALC